MSTGSTSTDTDRTTYTHPNDQVHAAIRLSRWVAWASAGFVLIGVTVALAGESALLGPYNQELAGTYFGVPSLPARAVAVHQFLFGILGASIVGKWVATAMLARYALARRQAWAYRAAAQSLLAWFVLDSATSIVRGALFNVLMINLFPLLLLGIPLVRARHVFATPSPGPSAAERARLDAFTAATCVLGCIGLLLALFGSTWIFSFFHVAMARTFFGGDAMPKDVEAMVAFLYGPIGATVVGHMLVLWSIGRHAGTSDAAWARTAVAASIAAWLVLDLGVSIAHGAWFNVVCVELPTVLLLGIPLAVQQRWRGNTSRPKGDRGAIADLV